MDKVLIEINKIISFINGKNKSSGKFVVEKLRECISDLESSDLVDDYYWIISSMIALSEYASTIQEFSDIDFKNLIVTTEEFTKEQIAEKEKELITIAREELKKDISSYSI